MMNFIDPLLVWHQTRDKVNSLPFRAEDVAFGSCSSGFEGRRYGELGVLYRVVRGAYPFAAGAEIEVPSIG